MRRLVCAFVVRKLPKTGFPALRPINVIYLTISFCIEKQRPRWSLINANSRGQDPDQVSSTSLSLWVSGCHDTIVLSLRFTYLYDVHILIDEVLTRGQVLSAFEAIPGILETEKEHLFWGEHKSNFKGTWEAKTKFGELETTRKLLLFLFRWWGGGGGGGGDTLEQAIFFFRETGTPVRV